jgi:glycosyltransferase involved in cell wall biosynthesis
LRPFAERQQFVMIGNFRHAPNRDSVHWVHKTLWKEIREALPRAELHVYGAYPNREDMALHSPKDGFMMQGPWLGDARECLSRYRVLLAPLRFGAGIKGKVLDAWAAGTGVLASPLAAEGMVDRGADYPGAVIPWGDVATWTRAAVRLHETEGDWVREQERGFEVLSREYDPRKMGLAFVQATEQRLGSSNVQWNWLAELLHQQEQSAARYLSRYIELKERQKKERLVE